MVQLLALGVNGDRGPAVAGRAMEERDHEQELVLEVPAALVAMLTRSNATRKHVQVTSPCHTTTN